MLLLPLLKIVGYSGAGIVISVAMKLETLKLAEKIEV
jgi:hypothetical protein